MLVMTNPVLFVILLAVLAVITVGALIVFRLILERRSTHPDPARALGKIRGH